MFGWSEKHEWHGDEIQARAERADGRALVGISEGIAADGKRYADVISGTMRRSIHSAPINYIGAGDEDAAAAADLPNAGFWDVVVDPEGSVLEVGSWVSYACVEEVGRGHQFMTPAVEGWRGPRSDAVMKRAYLEEGLV